MTTGACDLTLRFYSYVGRVWMNKIEEEVRMEIKGVDGAPRSGWK